MVENIADFQKEAVKQIKKGMRFLWNFQNTFSVIVQRWNSGCFHF